MGRGHLLELTQEHINKIFWLLYALMDCLETRYVCAQLNNDNLGSIITRQCCEFRKCYNLRFPCMCCWLSICSYMGFSSVGLFDWKKDKKFLARSEEPVSPEKESPSEDGEFFSPPISRMFYHHNNWFPFTRLLLLCLCEAGARC